MKQRFFITLSYDGTNYHGWQVQPNGVSVEECMEKALSTLLRQPIDIVGAGRTDAGVHARTMVAHFDLLESEKFIKEKGDCKQLVYRLNRLLPKDISVQSVEPVEDDMHARFSAKWRTYHYYIHTRKDPFLRHYFASFCKAGADNKTTLCDVKECRWIQTSDSSWYLTITANRFLRNMVRATVGTLFLLGRHRITLSEFEDILNKGSRNDAGESMPGNALFLESIVY